MNLDSTWLFLSLIPGGIGFVLLAYGKKQGRWPHMVAGLLFMAYPYLATTVTTLIGGGLLVTGLLWTAVRLGW